MERAITMSEKQNPLKDAELSASEDAAKIEESNPNFKWYVVHTSSGMENKARQSLKERIVQYAMEEKFGDILVPTETVEHVKNNVRRVQSRKCMPGYMLVQMELNLETSQLVRATPKIAGFVGGSKLPQPLSQKEADRMIELAKGVKTTVVTLEYNEGENVKVIDGPFANFQGTIEEVKPDKKKLRVLVSIFGRSTPVELDYHQVEKL